MWGRWLLYKRTKNSRANSWKRSHKILITVPSAQVHIVDGGHFSIDTAPDEIAARVREFMDMPKESVQGEEIMATATTRAAFSPFTRDSAMHGVRGEEQLPCNNFLYLLGACLCSYSIVEAGSGNPALRIRTRDLTGGLTEPGFETRLAESCVTARNQCSLADFRPRVKRIWVSDDFAGIFE